MHSPYRLLASSRWLIVGLMVLGGRSVEGSSVSAGAYHSAIVKTTDNTAWAWGNNTNGRLGDGSTSQRVLPVPVTSLSGVTAVAAGGSHTLFLKSDGTVWATGLNSSGQLGNNSTTQSTSPVQVRTDASTFLTGVTAIAAGTSFSLARKSDGTVWSWGSNSNGQLGINAITPSYSTVAVQVKTGASTFLTDVSGVAAGDSHALAVKADGTVSAWGNNVFGRLGDGTTTQSLVAIPVGFPSGVVITKVAAGSAHSLARSSTGAVFGWGNGTNGRLGIGQSINQQLTPIEVTGVTGVVDVSAGNAHSVAVDSAGIVFTWGLNTSGQLGDGSGASYTDLPAAVAGIANAISAVASADHTLAVSSDGVVWVWGANGSGRLGDGTAENRTTPVAISEPGYVWKAGTPTFSQASGTYAVTSSISTTITSATTGATIRYTLDGTDPTPASTAYSGALTITQSLTLKARAYLSGIPASNVGLRTYELKPVTPTFTVGTGTYFVPPSVGMSTTTTGATIRYTTDGSEPTTASTPYSGAVSVDVSQTLKAKAFKDEWSPSDTRLATYTLKVGLPSFNPAAGSYSTAQEVAVTTVTPGATLRHTTDGRDPVETDAPVTGTILVGRSLTLKVRGWKSGWTTSDPATATYLLNLGTVANPTFDPPGGTFSTAPTVTLSGATSGAQIRYTLDGTDPTSQSLVFASPFTLATTTTVKAKAFVADGTPSPIVSATYTVNVPAAETPVANVASGWYTTGRTVTITAATADEIHYTTNGADPTQSDTSIVSGGTLLIDRSLILKVRTWKSGLPPSAVVRRDYVVTGALAAGLAHTLALKADGTLWSWGANASSRLGRTGTAGLPGQVSGLTDVVAIDAGGSHSLAVLSNGAVAAFGSNDWAQIGTGSKGGSQATPWTIPGLSNVVAVAAGASHSLALKADGKVMGWGRRSSGQLGLGSGTYASCTTTECTSPVEIPGLENVVAIAAGANHSLALKSDGTVVGFGADSNGQIGDGTASTTQATPVPVVGLTGITRIAAGGDFSMALKADGLGHGSVWLWGANGYGQMANGTALSFQTPPVIGPSSVVALTAGESHAVVLVSDGALWAWGRGYAGSLGDFGTSTRTSPVPVASPPESLGLDAGDVFSLALAADGRIFGWGANAYSQASGDGTGGERMVPAAVPSFAVADNTWLASDADQDGLTTASEYRIGTDPLNPDSNGNGLSDGVEMNLGRTPTSPDTDGDGLPNWREAELGTDLDKADSDGDGVLDGADAFPLDPTQSQATPDPGDTTPPVVTLQEPTNAVEQ